MSPDDWRVIPYEKRRGNENMAIDDYFARKAFSRPVLRVYGWSVPTISLGYHQDPEVLDFRKVKAAGIDVVRRPTGGRAILHAEELTYAVILPGDSPLSEGSTQAIHNRLSEALAAGLQHAGADVQMNTIRSDLRDHYKSNPESAACFSSMTRYELQLAGRKVVGSAQRKYPHAILQHGSVLVGPAHRRIVEYLAGNDKLQRRMKRTLEEKTTDLSAHVDTPMDIRELAQAVSEGFRIRFGIESHRQPLLPEELEEIRRESSNFFVTTDVSSADSVH